MSAIKLTIAAIMATFLSVAQPIEDIASSDYNFTMNASKSGLMVVKLGELAQKNSSSEEVKTLGKNLVAQHQQVNKELKSLADQRGIFLVAGLNEKQQKNYKKLSEMKGDEFDKAYVKSIIKEHKEVAEDYEKIVNKGVDPEIKKWASITLHTIVEQLMISEDTLNSVEKNRELLSYKY